MHTKITDIFAVFPYYMSHCIYKKMLNAINQKLDVIE